MKRNRHKLMNPIERDHGVRTKSEVAAILGVTRGAIYHAERHFLNKLKKAVMADAMLMQTVKDMGIVR